MRTARVRGRAAFVALRHQGRRSRRRAVQVTFVAGDGPPAVAFSIGRAVGTAVVRNRLRRRLRSILAELTLDRGNYLVMVSPAAAPLSFAELREQVEACLADLARSSS
jgi:ribonuclease P protein component